MQSKTIDTLPEIRVEHVSYSYPNSKKKVFDDISFVIHPGETVAIVGENGAGKSTLLKLLCGQYLPTEGDVYIQGISTKDLNWEEIAALTSAVFQNYMRYGMTLMENIVISENQAMGIKKEEDEIYSEKAKKILNESGFPLGQMPNGMETMLFRQFGGMDLSGGQWQKIVIARGCFRERNLFFLDEPTASIDPIEGKNIYGLFHDICRNKTAVIITHRLASARGADKIVVLDHHKLSEIGTHEELIRKKGVYRKMYLTQKEMYKEKG